MDEATTQLKFEEMAHDHANYLPWCSDNIPIQIAPVHHKLIQPPANKHNVPINNAAQKYGICGICDITKPADKFNRDKHRKNGLQFRCKQCLADLRTQQIQRVEARKKG